MLYIPNCRTAPASRVLRLKNQELVLRQREQSWYHDSTLGDDIERLLFEQQWTARNVIIPIYFNRFISHRALHLIRFIFDACLLDTSSGRTEAASRTLSSRQVRSSRRNDIVLNHLEKDSFSACSVKRDCAKSLSDRASSIFTCLAYASSISRHLCGPSDPLAKV